MMTGKGEPHVRHVRTRQSGQTALAIPWFFPETLPAVPARNHRRLGHPANPEQLRHAYAFVRAAQSHGRLELEVAWIGGGKQMLLLLQHGEQHFLTDVARLSRLVDDRRGAFVRLSLIRFAVFVGGLRFGAKRHGFQAFLAAACGTLFFDDGVHLLLAQRVPVEEQTI